MTVLKETEKILNNLYMIGISFVNLHFQDFEKVL